ncbi:MAG: DmsC/YnfH family molybdoenzyme membrane anchor subunit [Bacteroidales bacterium]|nr:DmsC/YnfH family molybdoenzyme membrane anchor subunit [Bacteroidales bacterium]
MMEEYNISLALFTWLTQLSVGIIILRAVYMRISSGQQRLITGRLLLSIVLVLLVTGLLFSFAHLKYPRHAFNALNNISSSWMSREILAELILVFSVTAWYTGIRFRIKVLSPLLFELLSVLAGIVLIFFMIKTYMLPAIPEMNHPAVPVSFIITPLLAGSSVIYLLIRKKEQAMAGRFKIVAYIMFIASLVNFVVFSVYQDDLPLLNPYYALWLVAAILLIISLMATNKNKSVFPDVIFLTLALICDFSARVYTLTYTGPGL